MNALLKLENIGFMGRMKKKRAWVAEIIGTCEQYEFMRQFLRPKVDYSQANSVGSRGVYSYYILEPNKLYEVMEHISWKRSRRYFCTVLGGEIFEVPAEEAIHWVNEHLT